MKHVFCTSKYTGLKYGTVYINQLQSSRPKYIPKVALSLKSGHFAYPIPIRFLCQLHRSMHFKNLRKLCSTKKTPKHRSLTRGPHPSLSLLLLIPILLLYTPIRIPHPHTLIKILFDPIHTKNKIRKKKFSHGTFSRVSARRAAEPATPGRRLSPGMWWW